MKNKNYFRREEIPQNVIMFLEDYLLAIEAVQRDGDICCSCRKELEDFSQFIRKLLAAKRWSDWDCVDLYVCFDDGDEEDNSAEALLRFLKTRFIFVELPNGQTVPLVREAV